MSNVDPLCLSKHFGVSSPYAIENYHTATNEATGDKCRKIKHVSHAILVLGKEIQLRFSLQDQERMDGSEDI